MDLESLKNDIELLLKRRGKRREDLKTKIFDKLESYNNDYKKLKLSKKKEKTRREEVNEDLIMFNKRLYNLLKERRNFY